VEAKSYYDGVLPEKESTWSFTTEPEPTTHRISHTIDFSAEPDVIWHGEFFNGFANPSFATNAGENGRVPHYKLIAKARKEYPHAWNLFRDAYLSGFAHLYNPFKKYPNIVRERQTRRITSIEKQEEGVLLKVEDFFGHKQYGIKSDRPISADYHKGDEILIADGSESARAHVIKADDKSRTLLVTHFDKPSQPWKIEYTSPLPVAENPDSPGLFPPGGTYLRKFDPPGTAHYYWGRLHHEWDLLVKEFGFRVIPRFNDAPGDLSINGSSGTNAKCMVQLHKVTYDIASHIIERYGDVTLRWPWVVLNEPDISHYWMKKWEETQQFYDYSSDAILRAFEDQGYDSNDVQIGGLELGAIGGVHMRLDDFLTHVSPNADGKGSVKLNAAYADARLDSKRSRRVEKLCAANGGRGAPFDFLSIHTYNNSEMSAAKLIRAKEVALEIDPEYFEKLYLINDETVPNWSGMPDPGASEMYLGNGYFPTWAANIVARLLQRGAEDTRYTYGVDSPLMGWPSIRVNFSTINDVVRKINLDNRSEIIPSPIFHVVNLLSTIRDNFWIIPPKTVGGHIVSGFAGRTDEDLRILLYSHDVEDYQSRSDINFEIPLQVKGIEWDTVEVVQYSFDKHNNSYYETAREIRQQPDYSPTQVYTQQQYQEFAKLASMKVTQRETHSIAQSGRMEMTAKIAGNGLNFIIICPLKK